MSFTIKFTPEALETYEILIEQLRNRWGDYVVASLENRIDHCLDMISQNPYLYAIFDESTGTMRCVLHENCAMLYKIYGEFVHIAWFWDNRQDPIFT